MLHQMDQYYGLCMYALSCPKSNIKNNFKEMNAPFLSVIIPIYKVEDYLERCVKSVLNQDFKDIEVILVDDGSPDRCPQICDEFAKTDERIKVLHKPNGGLSDARNVGMDVATGEYLMFADSDDFLFQNACEVLVNKIEKENADYVKWFNSGK